MTKSTTLAVDTILKVKKSFTGIFLIIISVAIASLLHLFLFAGSDSSIKTLAYSKYMFLDSKINPFFVLSIILLIVLLVFAFYATNALLQIRINNKRRNITYRTFAYIDSLTGGFNLNALRHKMKNIDYSGFLISMDIKAFKTVNSLCGMNTGDDVLKAVWTIIYNSLGDKEYASHANADNFFIIFTENDSDKLISRIELISISLGLLSDSMKIPKIMPYFGICHFTPGDDSEDIENKAIMAKCSAKAKDSCYYSFYSDAECDDFIQQRQLEASFDYALSNNEFQIVYQPKYNPKNDSIIGAEALVRWYKSDNSIISPNRFIGLFESNGAIKILDEYIFRSVCRHQAAMRHSGLKIVPVSVNLSRISIMQEGIANKYKEITESYSVTPDMIPIEITESASYDNEYIREAINQFKLYGFSVIMDDFGSGYSSLSSLIKNSFDVIKIDKSLTDTIGTANGNALIKEIICLAHKLNIAVTTEGVENAFQKDFLNECNCDNIQGYYYSKPLTFDKYKRLLSSTSNSL